MRLTRPGPRRQLPAGGGRAVGQRPPKKAAQGGAGEAPAAGGAAASIQTQGWEQQAASSVKDVTMDKFRSVALYAEVKLTEALTRVKTMRLKANDGHPVPEDEPDRLRTAVCVQVFSELCKMAGPFSSVLSRLRDEFVLSMYSDYYVSEGGDSVFDQQPYFSAIKRIEQERAQLLEEQERFRDLLMDREEDIQEIEDRSSSFAEMMQKTAENTESLQRALEASEKAASQVRADLEESNDECKVLQHEVRLLKLEVDEKTKELSNKESLRMELESLQKQHATQASRQQDLLNELSRAKDAVADSVPYQDFIAVKRKLDELLGQIEAANKKEGGDVGVEGILTPRPDWRALFAENPYAEDLAPPPTARTREAAAAVARGATAAAERGQAARDTAARLRLAFERAEALQAPDPEPRAVSLEVSDLGDGAEPSSGSAEAPSGEAREESEGTGPGEHADMAVPEGAGRRGAGGLVSAPLGMGREVPRYLRWSKPVPLRQLSAEETVATVAEVWAAKRRADIEAAAGPLTLQAFLYEFLRDRHSAPPAAEEESRCAGETGQATVAREGYSLLYALEQHAAEGLFEARTFLHVLRGEAGEGLFADRARMLRGIEAVCRALDARGEGRVVAPSLQRALLGFFPNKGSSAHEALSAALARTSGAVSGGEVHFQALLAEGSAFRAELERQHLEEVVGYVAGLEQALEPSEGTESRTLAELGASISAHDPSRPEQDVLLLVARGAGAPSLADLAAGGLAGAEEAGVRPFLRRLKRGFLRHASSYVPQSAGELMAREKMDLLNDGDTSTSLPDPV